MTSPARPAEHRRNMLAVAEKLAADPRPEVQDLVRKLVDVGHGVPNKLAFGFDQSDVGPAVKRERDDGLRALREFTCAALPRETAAEMVHKMVDDHLQGRSNATGRARDLLEVIASPIRRGLVKLPGVQHLRKNILR